MHIRHVSLANVRRFGAGAAGVDLTLPPRGWIVVAGPNGSGKTTFLRVIALSLSPALRHDFADGHFSWLRRGEKSAQSQVTLVPAQEDRFRDGTNVYSAKEPHEDLVVGDDWGTIHRAMRHGRESEGNRAFAGPWHADPDGWFAAGYGAHRRLLGASSATEQWAADTTREGAFLTLFRDDAALTHPVRWLMDLDYRRLDDRRRPTERSDAEGLVDGVIGLLNDDLLDGTKVLGVDSNGLAVEVGGVRLSIDNLGTGAQVVVAFIVDILRHMHARFGTIRFAHREHHPVVEHSGVVLIDEVEAHLHPSWQRRLGAWFCTHFPNLQFIVTTHSPFVCQEATENGLILLAAPGATQSARVADAQSYRTVVNGSVDEALLSTIFGLDHTWSDDAERKREHLAELEARVLTGKAQPAEREAYKSLIAEIPQTMSDDVERAAARVTSSRSADAPKR